MNESKIQENLETPKFNSEIEENKKELFIDKNSTPEELVENFIKYIRTPGAVMVEAKKFLTITNQEECKLVGKPSVEGAINGIANVVKFAMVEYIKRSFPQPSPLVCDIDIKLSTANKASILSIRCIKESGVRKPDPDGYWGINAFSLKLKK